LKQHLTPLAIWQINRIGKEACEKRPLSADANGFVTAMIEVQEGRYPPGRQSWPDLVDFEGRRIFTQWKKLNCGLKAKIKKTGQLRPAFLKIPTAEINSGRFGEWHANQSARHPKAPPSFRRQE
jgi:hypothetical protein